MNVNSLHGKKKPSEMMGEYVAGRNRVNVMPHQTTANYGRPVSQGQARVAEIARQKKQQQIGVPVAPQTPAEIMGYQQARGQAKGQAATQQGGTVLTQEQVLANNINDIIKRMNDIMSQPGNLMSPSSSPYYNIYMEQYRKNAEAAEANAFARSVASSGGYGSSYATMAGQQAYRDTMEGFTELTPSLVQTKGQAMSDLMAQYQLAKGLKDQLDAEAEKADTAGNVTLRLSDGTELEVSKEARALYNYIVEDDLWDGNNTQSLSRRLQNQGYKKEDIDTVMRVLKDELDVNVTEVQDNQEKALMTSMSDLSNVDLTQFGYDQEEIEGMDDEEYRETAMKELMDTAKSMVKTGQLRTTAFAGMVEKDMLEGIDKMIEDGDDYAVRHIADYVIALDDYETDGVLTSDLKGTIMSRMAEKIKKHPLFKLLETSGKFEVELLGKFKNDEEREAFGRLIKMATGTATGISGRDLWESM